MRRYRPPIRLRVKFAVLINQRGLYNGEPLDPQTVEFDHSPALGLREYDELTRKFTPDANDPYYIVAKPKAVHHLKTNGTPATSAGSDKQRIAKVDRLVAKATAEKAAQKGGDANNSEHGYIDAGQWPHNAIPHAEQSATRGEMIDARCHRCGEYLQDGICPNCIPKSQPVRKIRSPGFAKLPKRMNASNDFRAKIDALTKRLTDEGMLMQAGWVSYRHFVLPPNASDIQIKETQQAFYAGAQHLFGSIMSALDEDKEPTDADMQRMSNIAKELEDFGNKFRDVAMPPKGHG